MNTLLNRVVVAAAMGLSVLVGTTVHAAVLYFDNPSFEDDVLPLGAGSAVTSGWYQIAAGGGFAGHAYPDPAGPFYTGTLPDGPQVGAVAGTNFGTLSQYVSSSSSSFVPVPIVAGITYTFTIEMGSPANEAAIQSYITIGSVATAPVTPEDAYPAGFTTLYTSGGDAIVIDDTQPITPSNTFAPVSISFTALAGESYIGEYLYVTLGKAGINPSGTLYWDDAHFTSVIPEPASLALLALGSLLVAGRRRAH